MIDPKAPPAHHMHDQSCKENYVTKCVVDLTHGSCSDSCRECTFLCAPKAASIRLLSYSVSVVPLLPWAKLPKGSKLVSSVGVNVENISFCDITTYIYLTAWACISVHVIHTIFNDWGAAAAAAAAGLFNLTMGATILFLVALASTLPVALRGDDSSSSLFLMANGYTDWIPGHATWYGDPYGEGSSGTHLSLFHSNL